MPDPNVPTPAPEAEQIREEAVQNIVNTPQQALNIAEAAERRADSTATTLQNRVSVLVQRAEGSVSTQAQDYADSDEGVTRQNIQERFPGFTFTFNEGSPIRIQSVQINAAPQAPNAAPNAATNTPPANLNTDLHARFNTLDPAEQSLVSRVMTSLESDFTSVPANQENLIGALEALDPQKMQAFVTEINGFGNNPTEEQLRTAVGHLNLSEPQGRILSILAQHHRDILAAPAAGPQQAPAAPFSEDERTSFGAEARRLDGLTGQGSVLQRAMGRLQLAFKGVDLSKLPSVERAEGMAKFVSIIVALVELVGAIKNPSEDAGKKRAEELANLSPEQRNKKQGIDRLIGLGPRVAPPVQENSPDGTVYEVDKGDTSSRWGPPMFKFEGGKWLHNRKNAEGIEEGWRGAERPMYSASTPEWAAANPEKKAKFDDWNRIAGEIGGGNTQAARETQDRAESGTRVETLNQKKTEIEAALGKIDNIEKKQLETCDAAKKKAAQDSIRAIQSAGAAPTQQNVDDATRAATNLTTELNRMLPIAREKAGDDVLKRDPLFVEKQANGRYFFNLDGMDDLIVRWKGNWTPPQWVWDEQDEEAEPHRSNEPVSAASEIDGAAEKAQAQGVIDKIHKINQDNYSDYNP